MKVSLGKYLKGDSKRRINIEIDQFDTWGLDHTLSLIILPALIQLKETKHGVPSQFVSRTGGADDLNYVFDFIREDENRVFDELCEMWNETLDKIIWSFQQIAIDDNYDNKYHHGKMDIGWQKTETLYPNPVTGKLEATYEMIDKNPNEHWYDYVGHRLHEDRIQEGLELFGKHFRDLWD